MAKRRVGKKKKKMGVVSCKKVERYVRENVPIEVRLLLGYCIVLFCLGRLGVSIYMVGWFLLFGPLILVVFERTRGEDDRSIREERSAVRTTTTTTTFDPVDLFRFRRPDVESVQWLNDVIHRMWPYLTAAIEKNAVTPRRGSQHPGAGGSSIVRVRSFRLGRLCPVLDGVKTYTKTRDSIVIDMGVRFVSDASCRICLECFFVPALVTHVTFEAVVRVTLEGIGGELPCVDQARISFVQMPRIDVDARIGSAFFPNMWAFPVVGFAIRSIASRAVKDTLFWPKHVTVPIRGGGGGDGSGNAQGASKRDDGEEFNRASSALSLTVDVIAGLQLDADRNASARGTFYVCTLRIEGVEHRTQPSSSSSVKDDECTEAYWNESFRFRLRGVRHGKEPQRNRSSVNSTKRTSSSARNNAMRRMLLVAVFEASTLKSQRRSAVPVGIAKVSISELTLNRTTGSRVPLVRVGTSNRTGQAGYVLLRTRLSSVVCDSSSVSSPSSPRASKVRRVTVLVHRCMDLISCKGSGGTYVSVRLGDNAGTTQKTSAQLRATSPVWEETLVFHTKIVPVELHVEVKGHNLLMPDEFLGQVSASAGERSTTRMYRLLGVESGALELTCRVE